MPGGGHPPGREARGWPRGEPGTILLTSWLRLSRTPNISCRKRPLRRARLWGSCLLLRHSPTAHGRNSLAAINTLKLCKCCKSSALPCGNSRTKTLDSLTQISLLHDHYSRFFATTGPSATLSSSSPFPVLPVIGRTCSSDFSLGRGGLLQFAYVPLSSCCR